MTPKPERAPSWRVMTRRDFLRLTAIGSAGSVLAACAPSSAGSPTAASQLPAPAPTAAPQAPAAAPKAAASPAAASPAGGGNLRFAVSSLSAQSLDPTLEPAQAKMWLDVLYDTLVGMDSSGRKLDPATGLATRWVSSPDGLSWTFSLREGVKFHNGDPVTSADVKFSLERFIGEKSRSAKAGQLRDQIKAIDAPDPGTAIVRLKQPTFLLPYILSPLGGVEGYIMPRRYVEQVGEDGFRRKPVGSGPYKFAEFVPGSRIALEAADPHFAEGAPRYRRLELLEVPEESTRVAQLRRGDVEIIAISSDRVDELRQAGLNIFDAEDSLVVDIKLAQQWESTSPLSDRRVREALNIAINRDEIVQSLLKGRGAPARSWMGSYSLGYREGAPIPYNPSRARELLREAGYPSGFALNFYLFPRPTFPEGPLVGQALVGYWEAVGVRSNVINIDYGIFRPRFAAKELQNPAVGGPHPQTNRLTWDSLFVLIFYSKGQSPVVQDDRLDALIDKVVKASSEEEYVRSIGQVHDYVWDNWLHMSLLTASQSFGASKSIQKWDLGRHENGVNLRDLLRQR